MNVAQSSIRVFVAKASSSVIVFLGIAYFARELGSHEMGVFFLFQALLGMIAIPADFGIGTGVTKRLSEGESPGVILSTAVVLKTLLLLPFIVGIIVFRTPINDYLGGDLAVLLVLALVLQEAAKLTIQVLKGELRVGETAGPTFSRKIVYVFVGAALVSAGVGVRGIIYGLLAGSGVMFVWGIWKTSTPLRPPSFDYAQSLFDYSKYAFISSIGGYFYSWMDVAIIGLFLTQSDVGVYEIAWRVTAVTMLFSSSIATSIFPQVSQWHADDTTERIEKLLPKAIAPALFLVVPAFFGVILFSREILGFVFGSEYIVGWLVLVILMGEKVLQSVHIILGRSLQGINRPDLAAKSGVIAIVINLILNVVLILQFGIVGAALATAASFVVNSILHGYYLSQFVAIRFPYHRIAEIFVASLGMSVILWGATSVISIQSLPTLLLMISLGIAVYGVIALLLPQLREMIIVNVSRITS